MMSSHRKRRWSSVVEDSVSDNSEHIDKRQRSCGLDLEIRTSCKRKYEDTLCESCFNNQVACYSSTVSTSTTGRLQQVDTPTSTGSDLFNNSENPNYTTTLYDKTFTVHNHCSYCRPCKRHNRNPRPEMIFSSSQDFIQVNHPFFTNGMEGDPEFNSFNFWRPVLPDIDAQLAGLLEESMESEPGSNDHDDMGTENPQFNSFNYWRMPVPAIDIDISKL